MKAWSRREVLSYLERVESATTELDHFALLDVAPDATDDDIQDAFHRTAGGIHPDRHRSALTAEQRERLTVVYARIAEAYRVLRDQKLKDDYMRKLGRSRAAQAPPANTEAAALSVLSPKAQRFYRRAKSARARGDRASTLLNLKMALRLHPKSAFLRETMLDWKGDH